jgi:tetratricopeptide (TPR) repeat protein
MIRRFAIAVLFMSLAATTAQAQRWYDHYDAGLAAVRSGDWNAAVQKMTAAIKGNAKEQPNARTYGMNTVNYRPFYYRGVAYLQTGKYEEAMADLEKTTGPGPENLGSIDTLMERARRQLASSSAPAVETRPERPTPPVTTTPANPSPSVPAPSTPQIDPALRQRAAAALSTAKGKIQAAQQRRATTSPQYAQAMSMFTDATTRSATPRTNDDLNAAIALAENAADFADLAQPPLSPSVTATQAPAPTPVVPRSAAATTTVMEEADYSADVRRALENYFAGEFETATEQFTELTRRLPANGWLWAFLGASQYSQYAFDADERNREAALRSFRRARELRRWTDGLPAKYFSPRIRKAFSDTSG